MGLGPNSPRKTHTLPSSGPFIFGDFGGFRVSELLGLFGCKRKQSDLAKHVTLKRSIPPLNLAEDCSCDGTDLITS
eukprot:2339425-Amphidinium_carterae.1